jgi:hypothetical protein
MMHKRLEVCILTVLIKLSSRSAELDLLTIVALALHLL